jgi:uncharacterized protein YqeY
MIKQQIEDDLKSALLGGDKELATTLRTIKSAILDVEVNTGRREQGLPDDEIIGILIKESKKRQDAAKIYKDANDNERASKELNESEVISKYLPKMMDESEISQLVKEVIDGIDGEVSMQQMGQIIGQVKAKTGALADGSLIAQIVKSEIQK